jgi:hypothetical protein
VSCRFKDTVATLLVNQERQGLWVPACAGTTAARRKDRALPQIGRDVVKIGGMDGNVTFVVRGTSALASNAKQGKADERHVI